MVGSSRQHPVHHEDDFVLWWKGIDYRFSGSHPNWAQTIELGCNPSNRWVLGQGWDQVAHRKL